MAEEHTDAPQCPVLPPRGPAAGPAAFVMQVFVQWLFR